MTDRELLELAAKAAGIEGTPYYGPSDEFYGLASDSTGSVWNPLDDDGDALRLAVRLGLNVDVHRLFPNCGWELPWVEIRGYESRRVLAHEVVDRHRPSLETATRRAIVRAAAEIGLKLKMGGAA